MTAPITSGTEWMDFGSCRSVDPELWFPEKGESPAAARRVCRACPVLQECRQHVTANPERFGVWAGLTDRQRRRLQAAADPEASPERDEESPEPRVAIVHLTDDLVREIRRAYNPTKTTYQKLGAQFGISASYARRICKGTSMGHVPEVAA